VKYPVLCIHKQAKNQFLNLFVYIFSFLFSVLLNAEVITPNVGSLPWVMDGDVRVFHLIAEPIKREFAPGFLVNCWGYNGSSPGPTIEAVEGERVRIFVTNNQRPILPGQTFKYEFVLKQNGTYMYHPHYDEMTQIAMGMMGFFVIHPKEKENPPVDRDYAIFLHEWRIPMGTKTPLPFEMLDFNIFTFNSALYPQIESLVAKMGDRVRIRLANVMMNAHPIHLHGHEFTVTRIGASRIPLLAQHTANTITVEPGETRDIEFIANNPGDWALHCHKSHHVMNQMQHDLPNVIGIKSQHLDERIRKFFPDFMGLMNINGMGEMFDMYGSISQNMAIKTPSNISPIGSPGPFGVIEMSGMFTIFKVREHLAKGEIVGWYHHPKGSVAEAVSFDQVPQALSEVSMGHMNRRPASSSISWFSRQEQTKETNGN
jgi:manganese oxidase